MIQVEKRDDIDDKDHHDDMMSTGDYFYDDDQYERKEGGPGEASHCSSLRLLDQNV